jgi:hypothetical protein
MKKNEPKKQPVHHPVNKTSKAGTHSKPTGKAAGATTSTKEHKSAEKKNEEVKVAAGVDEEVEEETGMQLEEEEEKDQPPPPPVSTARPPSSKKSVTASVPIELDLKNLITTVYDFDVKNNENFKSTRWPLVIDTDTGNFSSFLRNRDTNYINCVETESMQAEKFRISLISAIRNGKCFIIG